MRAIRLLCLAAAGTVAVDVLPDLGLPLWFRILTVANFVLIAIVLAPPPRKVLAVLLVMANIAGGAWLWRGEGSHIDVNLTGVSLWGYGAVPSKPDHVQFGLIVQLVNYGPPKSISAWKCEIGLVGDDAMRELSLLPPDPNFVPPPEMDGRLVFLPDNSILHKVQSPIETLGQRVGSVICRLPTDIPYEAAAKTGTRLRVRAYDVTGQWWDSNIFPITNETSDKPFFVPGMVSGAKDASDERTSGLLVDGLSARTLSNNEVEYTVVLQNVGQKTVRLEQIVGMFHVVDGGTKPAALKRLVDLAPAKTIHLKMNHIHSARDFGAIKKGRIVIVNIVCEYRDDVAEYMLVYRGNLNVPKKVVDVIQNTYSPRQTSK